MMRYHRDFNPLNRQSPTPRPDYLVVGQGKVCAILDAKYRDLWDQQLPREMLYQLAVYAMSHSDLRRSSILYPTIDSRAKESRIEIADPLYNRPLGQICLRPVHLSVVAEMVKSTNPKSDREKKLYAKRLAFGTSSSSSR